MNIETKIKIELDCTPRLEAVLMACVEKLSAIQAPQPKTTRSRKSDPKPKEEAQPLQEVDMESTEMAKTNEKTDQAPAQEQEAKPAAATEAPAEKPKEPTEVEVRAAIKACRERLMNGSTDPVLQATVRDMQKALVASYGVENSKALKPEQRAGFIKALEKLELNTNDSDEVPF